MTDPALVAAAVVTVVSAMGAACVTIINAIAAAKDRSDSASERRVLYEKAIISAKTQDDISHKADNIIEKSAEIHTLTNSANSELKSALAVMTEKYNGLVSLISQLNLAKSDALAVKSDTDLAAARLLVPLVAAAVPSITSQAVEPLKVEVTNIPNNMK
jgi:hypothetical protein